MNDRPSVLLVDDARDMLELLRRNMAAMGLTPFAANNVVDAIEVLGNSPVDLVITDLNMPGIGGLQLVKYLSQHHPGLRAAAAAGKNDKVEIQVVLGKLVQQFAHRQDIACRADHV